MPIICLQAGHQGRTTGATGAPGEVELNVRVRDALRFYLQDRGFVVQLVAADPPDSEIKKDFDLFLSLHGDADIYKGVGGGCIASGDPKVDAVWQRSAAIRDAIDSEYFKESGIERHQERVNANMTQYYMWSRLTSNTPCVLLEMGVVQNPHDKVILADTDRICKAIARGVCKAFGVPYDLPAPEPPAPTPEPTPTPPTPPTPPVQQIVIDPKAQIDMGDRWGVMTLEKARTELNDATQKLGECISKPKLPDVITDGGQKIDLGDGFGVAVLTTVRKLLNDYKHDLVECQSSHSDPRLQQAKDIMFGKGFWFIKYYQLKKLLEEV